MNRSQRISLAPTLALAFMILFAWHGETLAAPQTLLPFGSAWRYRDNGSLPAANWYATNFADGSWKYNAGQFGYGEGDELTLLDFGSNPSAKFVTTYFRSSFYVGDPSAFTFVAFRVLRDPGVVVYLNGVELFRDNMPEPPETIVNGTYASSCLNPPEENALAVRTFPGSVLRTGSNYIALELHQCSATASDLSFDLSVLGETNPLTRGPYLQVGTSSNIIVRWRTSIPTTTRVRYGTQLSPLNQSALDLTPTTEHEILLPNLSPATKYFYEIGTATEPIAGDSTYFFYSAPVPGTSTPVRVWAIGDFGTGSAVQLGVRDAYSRFNGARYTDVWLMLGDNAYCCGADTEYQSKVFDIYPTLFRQTVVWPTVGNHDTAQSSAWSDDFPYYRIFTMPTNGQAGGVASGSKHYYSFDYANIHFVCLDSMATVLRWTASPMFTWLRADLANNTRDWVIAYWHHPPYTKGTHDSDSELELVQMRQDVLPILENYGVDLVLCGHSHVYERSYLIDGHYGSSSTFSAANVIDGGDGRVVNGNGPYKKPAGGLGEHQGTVYVVDGSSGMYGGGSLNHPAMYYSAASVGSVVLDIDGQKLDAFFLNTVDELEDYFTIDKRNATNVVPRLDIARAGTNAVITWPTSLPDYLLQSKGSVNTSETWTVVGTAAGTNGRRKVVTLPANTGTNRFFRLERVP